MHPKLAVLALFTLLGMTTLAAAQDVCSSLWYQRNAIFKEAGYCFRTPRGIRAFGNAGCLYDSEWDVPLSPAQRARVDFLKREERRYGCSS